MDKSIIATLLLKLFNQYSTAGLCADHVFNKSKLAPHQLDSQTLLAC